MRFFFSCCLLAFSILGPIGVHGAGRNGALVPDRKKDLEPAQTDEKSIQGTWTVVGHVIAGTFPDVELLLPRQWVFKENAVAIHHKDCLQNADFALDPTQPLKFLDLTMKPGPGGVAKDEVRCAVYRLHDDSVSICYAMLPNQERPKAFSSTINSAPTTIV